MAIQDVLAAELDEAATDESDTTPAASERHVRPSPFSMEYELDDYKIDAETANVVMTGLVAVTNLI